MTLLESIQEDFTVMGQTPPYRVNERTMQQIVRKLRDQVLMGRTTEDFPFVIDKNVPDGEVWAD